MRWGFFTLTLFILTATGCVRPPVIVMVDRATALEEQAAGSFEELEQKLDGEGMAPVPVGLTPDQLQTLGIQPLPLVNTKELTDADKMDNLLKHHCVGEGADGLLVETHATCRGASDRELTQTLVERVNQSRNELWRWMHEQRPKVPAAELRKNWTKNHARGVVCGGWMEQAGGKWEEKKC